jgi:hypothetical protein
MLSEEARELPLSLPDAFAASANKAYCNFLIKVFLLKRKVAPAPPTRSSSFEYFLLLGVSKRTAGLCIDLYS